MIRSAASKAMWVGRTTAAIIGLAMILALVVGVASTAFGANGGNFILGKTNVATLITRLAGPDGVDGTMFEIQNNNAGKHDTALSLKVQSEEPPMKVNSEEKVDELNADKLDGKDSSEFYAAGSTVADSEKLGGKAPAEFAAAFKRTVVVSPVGTDTENGTALLDAMQGITDASAAKPYLLYIEPGTYDLGTGSLAMKQHVDIQGAGELQTLITSGVDCSTAITGTVVGANNAELRFLTVRNTGGTDTSCYDIAIYNSSTSPRLTHVTAEGTGGGGGGNIGVFNNEGSSPTMTSVTATASGGTLNYGVYNWSSSPTMTDVTATASGGTSFLNGGVVTDGDSSPTIRQSKLSGSGNSLVQSGVGTPKVALTQLEGPVSRFGGSPPVQCFNNFDQNLAAVTCP